MEIKFPSQRERISTFQKFPAYFKVHPLTEYIFSKNQMFSESEIVQKFENWDLLSKICPMLCNDDKTHFEV